jgi:hypothetical protein
MDRLCARIQRRLDDAVGLEIAFSRGRRADPHGLVGLPHEGGIVVRIGIDRNRSHPESSGGAHDPSGDFAAVGDQER